MRHSEKLLKSKGALLFLGAAIVLGVFVFANALPSLSADEAAYYAELVDSDGNDITSPLVDGIEISFDFESKESGSMYTTQEDNVRLDTIEAYLRVVADAGEFNIKASAENLSGYLSDTGVLIKAISGTDSDTVFTAEITSESNEAYFLNGSEKAIFTAGSMYKLQLLTATKYESDQPPVSSTGITFGFEPELIGGYRALTFMSEGEVLLQDIYSTDSQIGSFPPVEDKPGYRLAGWYVGDDFEVKTDTYVRDLPGEQDVTIEARWILAPSGDWPKITDKLIDEQISDDKKTKTWETTYLWQDGSKYIIDSIITTDLDDNYLTGYADAVFKVKGQEDCSLRIIDDGDRILVFVPQINNLFLQ